jgi:hypothetical protein
VRRLTAVSCVGAVAVPGCRSAWEAGQRRDWRADGVIRAVSAVSVERCLLSVRATILALAVGRAVPWRWF